jgi:superfamily I DNA/RNA helicase
VFIAGAEEGITPLLRKDTDIEEERRLFYVALTRAKDELFITHSAQRKNYTEIESKTVSRFVKEIPASLIETVKKKQPKPEQMKLF